MGASWRLPGVFPQGDHQARRRTRAGQPSGRHPSHALTLPAPGNRRAQGTSTSLHLKPPTGLARAVCVDKAHARFLGGRDVAMRPAYPAVSRIEAPGTWTHRSRKPNLAH
jgi:hypothetical protein